MRRLNREFFQRRIDARAGTVPESLERAWRGEILTPPIRWIAGQKGTTVTMPRYAEHDLARATEAARAECVA